MDHFNATIKDGKLVKTRRGLQVSRQTFNGLSFVNSSPHDDASGPGPSGTTGAPSPTQHEFRFVEEGSESGRETPGPRGKDTEQQDPLSTAQGIRRRRRAARRGKSPAASRAGTPTQPSPMSSGYQILQFEHLDTDHDMLQVDPGSDTKASAGDTLDPNFPSPVDDRALFERHFNNMPRSMYPYEDMLTYNPARSPEFHPMITGDVAAVHCVLMCGSITEAVISQAEPTDVAYHISKICAMLNQKLNHDQPADPVTLHCIATLAWVGYYAGRLDHWHLHMRGLKKVLDLNGGMMDLPPWLLAEMYKADLRGATALASSPYLPFTRQYSSISSVVPSSTRDQTAASISALLSPLHIHSEVIDSLTSLANFVSAIRLARESHGTITFDPHAFTEEWQALTHSLLTCPGPLRATDPNNPDTANPYSTDPPHTTPHHSSATSTPTSPTESYMSNHRLLPSVPILPTAAAAAAAPVPTSPGEPLEPALRIAALLHLRQLLPDFPRNLGGYAVLLALLRYHLRGVIRWYGGEGRLDDPPPPPAAPLPPTARESPGIDRALIDPLLTAGATGTTAGVMGRGGELHTTPSGSGPAPALSGLVMVREAVLFPCLVGAVVSRLDGGGCGSAEVDVYRGCLREVGGLARLGDDDEGLALGEGLGFVGAFGFGFGPGPGSGSGSELPGLGGVLPGWGGDGDGQGVEGWDVREILRGYSI